MRITEVRIKLVDENNPGDGRLKAFAVIAIDKDFVVHDLKVIQGDDQRLFVAMPSRRISDKCPACGCKNHVFANFCNGCGAKLPTIACVECDFENQRTGVFCTECNAELPIDNCPSCGCDNLRRADTCVKCERLLPLRSCPYCNKRNRRQSECCDDCGQELPGPERPKHYADICHPINTGCRQFICDAVLAEYREAVGISSSGSSFSVTERPAAVEHSIRKDSGNESCEDRRAQIMEDFGKGILD